MTRVNRPEAVHHKQRIAHVGHHDGHPLLHAAEVPAGAPPARRQVSLVQVGRVSDLYRKRESEPTPPLRSPAATKQKPPLTRFPSRSSSGSFATSAL